jgi:hypothetical protein
VLATHFGQGNGDWGGGDFNADNLIDTRDFNALAANFGTSSNLSVGATVPEPASLTLVVFCAGLAVRRRSICTRSR